MSIVIDKMDTINKLTDELENMSSQVKEYKKQKRIEYNRMYDKERKNREKISERCKEKVICACGKEITRGSMSVHKKTLYHQEHSPRLSSEETKEIIQEPKQKEVILLKGSLYDSVNHSYYRYVHVADNVIVMNVIKRYGKRRAKVDVYEEMKKIQLEYSINWWKKKLESEK